MSSHHVVFLDLDGTILDSSTGIVAGLQCAYDAVGIAPPSEAVLRSWIGPPVLSTLVREMGDLGDEVVQRANRAFRAYFDDVGAHESIPFGGMPAAMEAMGGEATLVVVTHKPRALADIALAQHHLSELVQSVHAPSSPSTPVPKDQLFTEAIAAVRPTTSIAVGDRGTDVQAAMAHGIGSVGVTWGYGSPEELRSAGAVSIANAPAELPALTSAAGLSR